MDRELHTPGAVLDTSRSPHALLRPLPLGAMRVEGGFWAPRLERLRSVTLPQQHRQLEQSGRVDNFRRASGRRKVPFRGTYYDDSDVYKWMEAASYALATAPDRELRALLDGVIDEVAAAQRPDGYLSTYHTFEREGERYSDLENKHELYCAGHLIQAGVAHHRATGERSLLDVAVRAADHVCETFGPRGRAGAGGHEEIELALVELYRQTGDRTYLDRAGFFLDQRGAIPPLIGGRPYHQDHLPVREQREAMGHAVRLTYLACAMTDVAMETGDEGLSAASHALWESAFGRKAYITGALGSRYEGEAFGEDYELPNASSYAETCASIGGVMWNWRLLAMTGEARFAGWFETALYNGVLSGISLEGDAYFYANPLADRPPPSGEFAEPSIEQQRGSGQHRRQPWFACACCPPNIARLLASLPGYAYGMSDDGALWVHLYLDGWVRAPLPDGSEIAFGVETDYPWEGAVKLTINDAPDRPVALRLRVPGWARGASLSVNAQPVAGAVAAGEYATVERVWRAGDVVELELPMDVRRELSHPRVAANAGRVALARGPLVYCLEGRDHDADLDEIAIPEDCGLRSEHQLDLLGGVTVVRGDAVLLPPPGPAGELYATVDARRHSEAQRVSFTAVPYYAWANCGPSPMQVWTRVWPVS